MPRFRPPLLFELNREELQRIYAEIAARKLLDDLELLPVHNGRPVRTRKPKAEYL